MIPSSLLSGLAPTQAAVAPTATTPAPTVTTPAPTMKVDYEKNVPADIRIQSRIVQARTLREEAARLYQTRQDLPVIHKGIADAERDYQERQARVRELDARLMQAPPELPTGTRLTAEEGVVGILGAILGDPNAANSIWEVAQRRQQTEFANRQAADQAERQVAAMQRADAAQGAERLANQGFALQGALAEALGRQGESLAGMKLADANRLDGEAAQIQERNDRRAEQEAERTWIERRDAVAAQMAEDARRRGVADEARLTQQRIILAGLDENEDESVVEEAVRGLTELGFEVPPGAIELFRARARDNRSRAEATAAMNAALIGQRGAQTEYYDARAMATLSGDIGPGGSRSRKKEPYNWAEAPMPVEGFSPGDAFASVIGNRPALSDAAEAAFKEWTEAFGAMIEAEPKLGAFAVRVAQGPGGGSVKRSEVVTPDQYDAIKKRAEAARAAFRAAVPRGEWANYVKSLRAAALATIKDIGARVTDPAARKLEQDQVRRMYQEQTGEKL